MIENELLKLKERLEFLHNGIDKFECNNQDFKMYNYVLLGGVTVTFIITLFIDFILGIGSLPFLSDGVSRDFMAMVVIMNLPMLVFLTASPIIFLFNLGNFIKNKMKLKQVYGKQLDLENEISILNTKKEELIQQIGFERSVELINPEEFENFVEIKELVNCEFSSKMSDFEGQPNYIEELKELRAMLENELINHDVVKKLVK